MAEAVDRYHVFRAELARQYADLFVSDPAYAYSAAHGTPDGLAAKMAAGLSRGGANKDGAGIRRTCQALGIKYTYGAIAAYLAGDEGDAWRAK